MVSLPQSNILKMVCQGFFNFFLLTYHFILFIFQAMSSGTRNNSKNSNIVVLFGKNGFWHHGFNFERPLSLQNTAIEGKIGGVVVG
jgi:hypothetical protein